MMTIENLSKSFRNHNVLEDINLQLENGHIYGFLGRNGVGKTTLLKLLGNQLIKDGGKIYIDGEDDLSEKTVLIRENTKFEDIHIENIIEAGRILYENWDEELFSYLVDEFEIELTGKYKKLSKGNQIIVNIIVGLSSGVKIILLDEPFANLDPVYKYKLKDILLNKIIDNDKIIVISSNSSSELTKLIDHLLILDNRNITFDSSIEEISEKAYKIIGNEDDIDLLLNNKNIIHKDKMGGEVVYYIYDSLEDELLENPSLKVSNYSIEDLFVFLDKGGYENDKFS